MCFLDNGDILLASGSQDATIMVWRFHPPSLSLSDHCSLQEQSISIGETELTVKLETVLQGHEGCLLYTSRCV